MSFMMLFVTADALLIEGLQAAEDPTAWDLGDTTKLEKFVFEPTEKEAKQMKMPIEHTDKIRNIVQKANKNSNSDLWDKRVQEWDEKQMHEKMKKVADNLNNIKQMNPWYQEAEKNQKVSEEVQKEQTLAEAVLEKLKKAEDKKQAIDQTLAPEEILSKIKKVAMKYNKTFAEELQKQEKTEEQKLAEIAAIKSKHVRRVAEKQHEAEKQRAEELMAQKAEKLAAGQLKENMEANEQQKLAEIAAIHSKHHRREAETDYEAEKQRVAERLEAANLAIEKLSAETLAAADKPKSKKLLKDEEQRMENEEKEQIRQEKKADAIQKKIEEKEEEQQLKAEKQEQTEQLKEEMQAMKQKAEQQLSEQKKAQKQQLRTQKDNLQQAMKEAYQ